MRPVFTPNGDAFNDTFGFINMALYQNITVTIFDLDDNTIYSSENYELPDNVWPVNVDSLDSGTYKYKVVIENEQTFVEYGYVCLVKTPEDGAEFSFVNECSLDFFDPILE
ncbi:gliding motility-associated C-terminal domain-containing protein [Winogradskyella damuponensis]